MNPWDERFYSINKTLMTHIGLWPYKNREEGFTRFYIVTVVMLTFVVTQVARLITSRGDFATIMEVIPPALAGSTALVKTFNCYLNRKKITQLLNCIYSDFQEKRPIEEQQIMINYAEKGRVFVLTYLVNIAILAGMFCLLPLTPIVLDFIAPLNETRPKIYLFQAEYFIELDNHFFPVMLHMWLATYWSMAILITMDTMFMTYVQHACTLYSITGYRMENMFDDWDTTEISDYDKLLQTTHRKIAFCIKSHQKALDYSILLESSYKWKFFVLIACVLIILTLTFVQIVLSLGHSAQTLRYSFFATGQLIHLFCYSYPAQKLQNHSLEIFYNAFNSGWYNAHPSLQQFIILTMMRSMKPCLITAGGYYVLCLDSFMTVVQTAVSYFTVLSSVG